MNDFSDTPATGPKPNEHPERVKPSADQATHPAQEPDTSEIPPTPEPAAAAEEAPEIDLDSASPAPPTATKHSPVEVLPAAEKGSTAVGQQHQSKQRLSWLPWRRPNRRDEQLTQLRDGYSELLGLIRSISGHLDRQRHEASYVSTLVDQLPPVLGSFEKLATTQEQVSEILGRINTQMEGANEKDAKLLESMRGFDQTVREASKTQASSIHTLDRVQDRISDSDVRMQSLFSQAAQSNDVMGNMMLRLERRLFVSNSAIVIMLALVLCLGVVLILKGPMQAPQAVPTAPAPAPIVVAPAPQNPAPIPTPAVPAPAPEIPAPAAPIPVPVSPSPTEPAPNNGEASSSIPQPGAEQTPPAVDEPEDPEPAAPAEPVSEAAPELGEPEPSPEEEPEGSSLEESGRRS